MNTNIHPAVTEAPFQQNADKFEKSYNGQPEHKSMPLPRARRMSDVQAEPVEWLWRNRIPLRDLTFIEGIEGVGKSTLLTAIATGITCGRGLPQSTPTEPANVLWFSAEDDLKRVLKPRLLASGTDCERVFAEDEPFTFDKEGLFRLRREIAENTPLLVIIDPIFAYTRGDANKGNDARALTNELKKIAAQFNCAICLVRHVGKSKGLGDPRAAGLYSIEWRAAARSVLLVGADPDQPQKRAIVQTKNNLGPMSESLGYVIEPDLSSPSGARFGWTGKSDLTAERILAPLTSEDDEEANERRDAVDFLRELLTNGEIESKEAVKAHKSAGISDHAFRKAKAKLRVQTRKRGGRYGQSEQKWYLSLPDAEGVEESEGVDIFENQRLLQNGADKFNPANGLVEGVEHTQIQHLLTNSTPSGRVNAPEGVEKPQNQRLLQNYSKQSSYRNENAEDVEGVEKVGIQHLLSNSTSSGEGREVHTI